MKDDTIGVILPCYNEEDWIAGAIESILNQTYKQFKLQIVDDGSTDRTAEIIKEFSDPRISYTYQENGGHPSALNTGLDLLDTEYYAIIDADDRWYPNKLERQIQHHKSTDAKLTHTNAEYIDTDGTQIGKHHMKKPPNPSSNKEIALKLFDNNFILHPSVMCHHSAIGEKRYHEELYANSDHDMWLRVAEDNQIDYVDEILVKYRIHDGNISNNYEELFEDRKTVARRFAEHNQLSDKIVNHVFSDIYLTYGINLVLDGRKNEVHPVLKKALKYDWTNYKIYGTYLLTYLYPRLLKSVSKAGRNYQ